MKLEKMEKLANQVKTEVSAQMDALYRQIDEIETKATEVGRDMLTDREQERVDKLEELIDIIAEFEGAAGLMMDAIGDVEN